MADEHWKKSNIVFGSAGMAASGMLPPPEEKQKPQMQVRVTDLAPSDTDTEPNALLEPDEEGALEFPLPEGAQPLAQKQSSPAPEPNAKPVEVKPALPGYGINSKAQGLFTDLTVGVLGNGSRTLHGYNWDAAFNGINGVALAGIANNEVEALNQMQQLYGFDGGYTDYRELLARTKPNLAVIVEEDTSQKYEMIKNALMSGAHVICPAPFTRTLEDADELVALADRRGLKLAVAYPMRLDPNLVRFHQEMDETIGDLIEMRIYGEMDANSGGYDLLMRGCPLFDIMNLFAGDPVYANANVYTNGQPSTLDHIVNHDTLGPLVGDTIQAQIHTNKNIVVNFSSDQRLREIVGGWGIDFVGSKNTMRLFGGDQPTLSLLDKPGKRTPNSNEQWHYWPELRDPYFVEVDGLFGAEAAHRLVIGDWLAAITKDRKAESSGETATQALEICHAIFQSAMTNRKVYFPIANRHHPLPEQRPQDFMRDSA